MKSLHDILILNVSCQLIFIKLPSGVHGSKAVEVKYGASGRKEFGIMPDEEDEDDTLVVAAEGEGSIDNGAPVPKRRGRPKVGQLILFVLILLPDGDIIDISY